jgi:hypothetical protein
VLGRSTVPGKIARGIDQPDVGECLGEITHQPARRRIVSFRQKTDVVTNIEQALKNFARFVVSAL